MHCINLKFLDEIDDFIKTQGIACRINRYCDVLSMSLAYWTLSVDDLKKLELLHYTARIILVLLIFQFKNS